MTTSGSNNVISFVGGGNMATSLIGGLIANGHAPQDLVASDPEQAQLDKLEQTFGITTTSDNNEALQRASTVVLSVKPQVMAPVTKGLAASAERTRPLVISIAAGVREPDLRSWARIRRGDRANHAEHTRSGRQRSDRSVRKPLRLGRGTKSSPGDSGAQSASHCG